MEPPKKRKRRRWIRALWVLIGLTAVLAGIAFWQLNRGPVSLSWFEPKIERELAKILTPLTANVADVSLCWRRAESLIEISIGTLELHDPDAPSRLALSHSVVALSFGAGKRPLLSPLYVEVQNVRVSLTRNEQGRFVLPLPKGSDQPAEEDTATRMGDLFGEGGTFAHLSRVGLSNLEFLVTDERWKTNWGSQGSHFLLTRAEDFLRAEGTLNALSGRSSPPVELEARWDLDRHQLTARLDVKECRPSAFVPSLANDRWLSYLTNKISARLSVDPSSNSPAHSVNLALDTPVIELTGIAELNLAPWHIDGGMELTRLDLQRLAPLHSQLEPLAGIDLETQGRIHYELGGSQPLKANVQLQTTPGQLRIPSLYPDGLFIDHAEIEVGVENGLEQIELKALKVDFGEELLDVQAQGGLGRDGFSAEVTAALNGVTMERLVALWPALAAPKPRQWISEHLRSGQANDVRASLSLGPHPEANRPLDLLDLTGAFDFSQLQLDVLPPLEPIAGVNGSALFTLRNGFRFQVKEGSNKEVQITQGQVSITALDTRSPVLRVDAQWQSPVARIIEILTSAPLNLADQGLLNAVDFSGQAGGTFGFSLSLAAESQPYDLGLEAYAEAFRWSRAPLDLDLAGDRVKTVLRDDRLTISGPVSANGVPTESTYVEFLDSGSRIARSIQVTARINDADREALRIPPQPILGGSADVTLSIEMDRQNNVDLRAELGLTPSRLDLTPLGWVKLPGEPGKASVTGHRDPDGIWSVSLDRLEATDLKAKADVAFSLAPSVLHNVRGLSLAFGTNDIASSLSRDNNGAYALRLSGKQFNTQPLFAFFTGGVSTNLWQTSGSRRPALPDLTLDVSFEQLSVGSDPGIRDFVADARYDQGHWDTVQIVGAPSPGQDLIISYVPSDSGHTLRANVDRAADLLAAALEHGDFEGGNLTIRATKSGPEQPLTGRLLVDNYLMRQAPVMGRLLKMSSMHGLLTTLTSKGLEITRYESDFSFQDLRLNILDAKLNGDLGLSGSGFIDFGNGTLNITGALAPMHSIQRAVGKIPLIGSVLAGRDSAGVFAGLYRIYGPLKDPVIDARPVSIFTPGITRDLFQMEPDSKSDQQPTPEAVKEP